MRIQQIILSGFRSFRQQEEIEPFSPHHNVVVGRNGSGKSNFFDAIQFVLLAPKFANLRQDERQRLLHEGAGQNVMSAFVEIIFDNADGRIAVDGDEIVLRRTVGLKKDEFFLNRRRVTKGEVGSLLESAGFSKSNPYYIVQQGKVNALCLMKDSERLNLLKEVAGTKVYEERRAESTKIIEETNEKREKIQEVISYIEERLEELEEEKEELRAYQQLDRTRRAIEYTMYDTELRTARDALTQLEEQVLDENERNDALYDQVYDTEESVRDVEAQVQQLDETLRSKHDAQKPLRVELDAALHDQAKLELEVGELEERLAATRAADQTNRAALEQLRAEETEQRRELNESLEPAYLAAKQEAEDMTANLEAAQRRATTLYQKQGRSAQYATAAERDAALEQEVAAMRGELQERTEHLGSLESSVAQLDAEIAGLAEGTAALEGENRAAKESTTNLKAEIRQKTIERNEAAEARKENWRALDALEEKLRAARNAQEQSERELSGLQPRHVSDGLERLRRIAKEEDFPGVFGPIIDNFTLTDDKFRRAVEVAAKGQLFYVIVDTDETAARLMERLEAEKAGRLTFLPLNRLRVRDVDYPESADVRPLLQVALQYDPRVDKAMREVFGRKLLARNMDVATEFSARSNMDAITLDGDEVNRRGALFGGFHSQRESAITAMQEVRKHRAEAAALREEQAELTGRASALEQNVTVILGDLQGLEANFAGQQKRLADRKREAKAKGREKKNLEDARRQKADMAPHVRAEVGALEEKIAALEGEMGSDLLENLTAAEQADLARLEQTVAELQAALPAASQRFQECALSRERVVAHLEHNLVKRMDELAESLGAGSVPSQGGEGDGSLAELESRLSSRQLDLESNGNTLAALQAKLEAMDAEAHARQAELQAAAGELERLKALQAQLNEQVEEISRRAQQAISRRQALIEKRDENMRKIQNVGTVPAAELGRFGDLSAKQLLTRLRKTQKDLKKYSHVNKKALDQYVSFAEQREALLERKAELDEGAQKIEDLILALDQQKDEAILRTFRGVAGHFTDVFRELVPMGRGELVMTYADGEEGEDASQQSVANFSGVAVQVSFTSAGERFSMRELSGGQKALVALTLVFAIQRSDPAPFYLFDEIDQALDANHRAAVAALIHKQAHAAENSAQFITVSFRSEQVEVADQHYGVALQNKVSNIHLLTRDETLGFVSSLEQEEAVTQADVTAASFTSSSSASSSSNRAARAAARKRGRAVQERAVQEDEEEEDDDDGGLGNAEERLGDEEGAASASEESEDEEDDEILPQFQRGQKRGRKRRSGGARA